MPNPGAQRPLLLQSLRELKSGQTEKVPREAVVRRHLQSYSLRIFGLLNTGTQAFAGGIRERMACGQLLKNIAADCTALAAGMQEHTEYALTELNALTNETIDRRRSKQYFNDFSVNDLEQVGLALNDLIESLQM